jgi:hypothetical protein
MAAVNRKIFIQYTCLRIIMMAAPAHEKATLYLGDLWGYDRIEARDVTWRFEPYAQYSKAARVEYTPRGKRKRKTAIITTVPLVILEGWDHPVPPAKYGPIERISENVVMRSTRRLSCDHEWENEFQAFLEGYLAGSHATVLVDFRKHDPLPR